jgi:hypothetical protein
MAPEILRGDRYDAKADLWSMGAILYEMLVGRPPFKAQNHVELLRRIDRTETVKFPGDDNLDATARKSVMVTNPTLSSPRTGANMPMGSLGSSPRFPSVMQGVGSIAEDLKDLVRRLLKKNPIERMSFEEFFMHPAVVGNKALAEFFDQGVEGAAAPIEFKKIRDENTPTQQQLQQPPPEVSPKMNILQSRRTSMDGPRQLQEQAAMTRTRSNASMNSQPAVNLGTSPVGSDSLNRQTPMSQSPSKPSDQIYHFHGELPKVDTTQTSRPSRRSSVATDAAQSSSLATIPEPPFAGYNLNPGDMFLDMNVPPQPTKINTPISPGIPNTQTAAASTVLSPTSPDVLEASPSVADRDPSSSLSSPSSLGSLELSDEGDEKERIVHIVRRNPTGSSTPPSTNSPPPPHPRSPVSKTPTPTQRPQQQQLQQLTPTPSSASRTDDTTEISEVPSNMIASQQFSAPSTKSSGTGTGSGGLPVNKASYDEYVVVEKRVVEVNWLADEVAASATGNSSLGTSPRYNNGINRKVSSGSFPIPPSAPTATSTTATSTAAIAVPHGKSGILAGTGQSPAGSYGSPNTPPSPRMLGAVGRTASRSSEPQGKGRIFGSLRDSTHNFLETSVSPLGGGPHQQAQHPFGPHANAPGAPLPSPPNHGQSSSPFQPVLQSTPWITGYEDDASLLTTLNLCVLRGHAINELADSRYRDLVAPSNPQAAPQNINNASNPSASVSEKVIDGAPTDLHAAEEALSLYLTALGLYQLGIEAARIVWNREQTRMTPTNSTTGLASLSASLIGGVKALASQASRSPTNNAGGNNNASTISRSGGGGGGPVVNLESLSASVQWIRERFNDCLDRAQDVRNVIGDVEMSSHHEGGARPVERVVYERALELVSTVYL